MSTKFLGGLARGQISETETFTALTVSLWIRTSSTSGILIARTTSPALDTMITLAIHSTGIAQAFMNDGAAKTVSGSTVVNDNQWHHIALAAENSGTLRLYVDGIEEGTALAIGTIPTTVSLWYVGAKSTGTPNTYTSFYTGKMSQLRIFSVAVTEQLIHWMAKGYNDHIGGEVVYIPFDRWGGSTLMKHPDETIVHPNDYTTSHFGVGPLMSVNTLAPSIPGANYPIAYADFEIPLAVKDYPDSKFITMYIDNIISIEVSIKL